MSIDRRRLLKGAAVAGATAAMPIAVATARAETSVPANAQAPAFHRIKVGDAVVTAISDGNLTLNAGVYPDVDDAAFGDAMEAAFLPREAHTAPVNAYVVESGGETVLVDAGGSAAMAPTLGKLDDNLSAAGIAASDIDKILITHLHPDHIGGLLAGGVPVFANAELIVRDGEVGFWTDPATRSMLPAAMHPMLDGIAAVAAAYGDNITPLPGDRTVAPGVDSVSLPGHTPGHTGFRVSSGDESVLIWGDIIHTAPLQLPNPEISIMFDADRDLAVKTRLALLDEVATDRLLVAGMHMPFPGFGFLEKAGDGYRLIRRDWQYQL